MYLIITLLNCNPVETRREKRNKDQYCTNDMIPIAKHSCDFLERQGAPVLEGAEWDV